MKKVEEADYMFQKNELHVSKGKSSAHQWARFVEPAMETSTSGSHVQLPELQSSLSGDVNLIVEKGAAASVHSSPKAYDEWVECVRCKKWRLCMPHIRADDLPESWECQDMTWLPGWNRCKFPQEETTAAVYKFLGWPLPSNDVGFLNVRGDIPEPATSFSRKQPLANNSRPAAMATGNYSVIKDENTKGIARKIKLQPASSNMDRVEMAVDGNSKGLAKSMRIRPDPLALVRKGNKEGTGKKLRLLRASSERFAMTTSGNKEGYRLVKKIRLRSASGDSVPKVTVKGSVKDRNGKGTPKKVKPLSSIRKRCEKRTTGSDKCVEFEIQNCSTTIGAVGKNKKVLKKVHVHGTDQWQISELGQFGDWSVGSKEREKPQFCEISKPKRQLTTVVSREREKLQACEDSDFNLIRRVCGDNNTKLKKQAMHLSPRPEKQVACSRPGRTEVSSKKDEAAFFIMKAEMEAFALKSAAVDPFKSMPGMKDENNVEADRYLQEGMKLLLSSRNQEEVCEGSKGSEFEHVIRSYSKAAEIIDDCTRRYEKIPEHGKAALAHIVAGLARMRLMGVELVLVASRRELEDLRKAESLFRQAKQDGKSEKASHGGASILPSRLYPSYNRFISNSANIFPMLESLNRANKALAIASKEAASTGDPHQQKGILEVRKVCSLVMLDDNFEKLVHHVYIALAAFSKSA